MLCVVVLGAGVVGPAVARALALAGREVLVLEACKAIGIQTSARNSEVIHACIYYPPKTRSRPACACAVKPGLTSSLAIGERVASLFS